MQNEFIRIMEERGYLNQLTDKDGLAARLNAGVTPAYIGYDATAASLHIGSLISIMMLRWYQKCGHKPIVLMGGGTTKIGDPTGKDEARLLISDDKINENINGIQRIFAKYLKFGEAPSDAIMVNNAEWLDKLNYIRFLCDYGRHFSVNRMLSFDSVKLRLEREQNLSFLEFNYMILQAYDFLELARRYGCGLQMGGSDQWGNIINGIDLGRRVDNYSLFGLTTSLLTTSSGQKMGKSANGAVWLNAEMLSPYEYWQYWRNVEDADVGRFLKLFTELPLDEIAKLSQLDGSEINEAKKILADHATELCHGKDHALMARKTAEETFGMAGSSQDLPSFLLDSSLLDEQGNIGLLNLLVVAGLVKSNGEARRTIEQDGLKINQELIKDVKMQINAKDFSEIIPLQISVGRKKHLLIRPLS